MNYQGHFIWYSKILWDFHWRPNLILLGTKNFQYRITHQHWFVNFHKVFKRVYWYLKNLSSQNFTAKNLLDLLKFLSCIAKFHNLNFFGNLYIRLLISSWFINQFILLFIRFIKYWFIVDPSFGLKIILGSIYNFPIRLYVCSIF